MRDTKMHENSRTGLRGRVVPANVALRDSSRAHSPNSRDKIRRLDTSRFSTHMSHRASTVSMGIWALLYGTIFGHCRCSSSIDTILTANLIRRELQETRHLNKGLVLALSAIN
ncbi:hypothetical protein CBL_13921 [Carabus blaptoides fortunei]